jgi:hypothetical protein
MHVAACQPIIGFLFCRSFSEGVKRHNIGTIARGIIIALRWLII